MDLLDELNKEQKKAVQSDGTVIIIAGPGTGKTKTLTTRIQYLIQEKNILPGSILALTFTQKAAAEMKERLSTLPNLPYIATFHSFAFDLLKNGGATPNIVSDMERHNILQSIQEKRNKPLDIRDLSLFITKYKNNIHHKEKEEPAVITEYNEYLQERELCDYDDLLLRVHTYLIEKHPSIQQYRNQYSYILIDEFQDTNNLQYAIIKQLTKNNIFVIGDPLQAIYSFRGGDASLWEDLKKDFPDHTEITLTTNYRSTKEVIHASSRLFPDKTQLVSSKNDKGEVRLVKTVNEFTEADWIVRMIDTKIGGTDMLKAGELKEKDKRKTVFSDFAVIYRTHAFSRILEQKLNDSGIPYQIIGGNSPFEKPEVAFIVHILQYVVHKSSLSLKHCITSPVLGVPKKSLRSLEALFTNANKIDAGRFYQDMLNHLFSKQDIKILSTFVSFLKDVDFKLKTINLLELIHKILQITYLEEYLDAKRLKQKHIHAFMSTVMQFQNMKDGIAQCVSYLDYLSEHEFYDPRSDKVTLLTMHAAKGLEFQFVFICGFEEGSIPFIKKQTKQNLAEEARLLYVGMTRAKEGLYLLYAKERNKKPTKLSRFYSLLQSDDIREMEDEAVSKLQKKIKKWREKKSQLQLF